MAVDQAWRSINAAYEEWAEHLGNPNFCRQGEVLTWQSRQRIWLRNEFDFSAYQQLAEARQYSFVVAEDGGLIQLHYEFDGDVLLKASAGYYGSSQITLIERELTVAETLEAGEPDVGAPEEAPVEQALESEDIEDRPTVVPEDGPPMAEIVELIPSVRFDYSPSDRRPYVHEFAHLHLPSFAKTRVAVSGFPSPQQFVELVFAWFYPEIYEQKYQHFAQALAPAAEAVDHTVAEPQYSRQRAEQMRASVLSAQSASFAHLPVVRFSPIGPRAD